MQVHIQNDGPVTISLETPPPKPMQQKQVCFFKFDPHYSFYFLVSSLFFFVPWFFLTLDAKGIFVRSIAF